MIEDIVGKVELPQRADIVPFDERFLTPQEKQLLDRALGEYDKIPGLVNDPHEERKPNPKLHVGVATKLADRDTFFTAHNDSATHAEAVLVHDLIERYPNLEDIPALEMIALVGSHPREDVVLIDAEPLPKKITREELPIGTPLPCYQCLHMVERLVRVANRKHNSNIPILILLNTGQVLKTNLYTLAPLPFPGSKDANVPGTNHKLSETSSDDR